MRRTHHQGLRFVFLSLLLGFVIDLLPLPHALQGPKPDMVLLLVWFWVFLASHRFHLGAAWGVGLFVDGVTGCPLGLHALGYLLTTALLLQFQRQFRVFPVYQQALGVALLGLLYQGERMWVGGMLAPIQYPPGYWLAPLFYGLFWLVLYSFLSKQRFRYSDVLGGGESFASFIH